MAVKRPGDPRQANLLWTRLHFVLRLLGLFGLLAAYAGFMIAVPQARTQLFGLIGDPDKLQQIVAGFDPNVQIALLVCLGFAALAVLVEIAVGLYTTAGRRNALGFNAVFQIVLATALLVGVNVWSYDHYRLYDWTRQQHFTLPAEVREQLAQLDANSETDILLYLPRRGSGTEKPDPFDVEAERKTVEKVKDLVDLFREVGRSGRTAGPRFRVKVLDVADKEFPATLASLADEEPLLRQAIEQADENSIFIRSGKNIQRMSFQEFYRLDRSACKQQDNLVLRAVGPGPITRRIVGVEERRPRIGLLTVHEYLSSEGPIELFTLSGARKALTAARFEIRDVILRDLTMDGPAADSLEVSKLERRQNELDDLVAEIAILTREIAVLEKLVPQLATGSLRDLNSRIADYAEQFNPRFVLVRISDSNRELVQRVFANQLAAARENLQLAQEERASILREIQLLDTDGLSEQRRLKDLRAKLARTLADVDLLLIPRLTMLTQPGRQISPSLYDLDARQTRAIRECLRAGKPLLACFGPTNQPPTLGRPGASPIKEPDELEKLLAELGILFGKRTVLFNVDKRAFVNRDDNLFRATELQLPPLQLGDRTPTLEERLIQSAYAPLRRPIAALGCAAVGQPLLSLPFLRPAGKPVDTAYPIVQSLRLASNELGQAFDLQGRFLRPIFLDPLRFGDLDARTELLASSAASWHDEQPFSSAIRPVPRFEPPTPDDPDNGTLEARRRGPFTVGVAVETSLPESPGQRVRVAALGQATLITGVRLNPAQQRLLVDTCNWLLGREERLAAPAPEWSYPRLQLTAEEQSLWLWGARQGLPLFFGGLGIVVLLYRRLR